MGSTSTKQYNEVNQNITETTTATIESVQMCSSNTSQSNTIEIDDTCVIEGDIDQSNVIYISVSCVQDSNTSVSTNQEALTTSYQYTASTLEPYSCEAEASGAGSGLVLGGAATGGMSCSLPQKISIEQTNILNQTIVVSNTSNLAYTQDCALLADQDNMVTCSGGNYNGNIYQSNYSEQAIDCVQKNQNVVESYQTASTDASQTAEAETASDSEFAGFTGSIILIIIIIMLTIIIAIVMDEKKKKDKELEKEKENNNVSIKAGETPPPYEPFPILSVIFFVLVLASWLWLIFAYEYETYPLADPSLDPAAYEEYEEGKQLWGLINIILLILAVILIIVESVLMSKESFGTDFISKMISEISDKKKISIE